MSFHDKFSILFNNANTLHLYNALVCIALFSEINHFYSQS